MSRVIGVVGFRLPVYGMQVQRRLATAIDVPEPAQAAAFFAADDPFGHSPYVPLTATAALPAPWVVDGGIDPDHGPVSPLLHEDGDGFQVELARLPPGITHLRVFASY